MNYAPVTLFVYNRPEHTRQTVDALKKNAPSRDSDLFIFSDAAKTRAQENSVAEVRKYIRTIEGFRSVSIVEREVNFGLAESVIAGVTSVINKYGRIIVLEDDLLVTPSFLDFMNRALDKYENEKLVMQISGYMFPVEKNPAENSFFLPLTTSWGWATWQRAWQDFDPSARGYVELKNDPVKRSQFNLEGSCSYYRMLESQLRGEIDSWAIRWWLSVFLRKGLVLYPAISLVENIGFDGSGTHCGETAITKSHHLYELKIEFPNCLEASLSTYETVVSFMNKTNNSGIRNWIRSIFYGMD